MGKPPVEGNLDRSCFSSAQAASTYIGSRTQLQEVAKQNRSTGTSRCAAHPANSKYGFGQGSLQAAGAETATRLDFEVSGCRSIPESTGRYKNLQNHLSTSSVHGLKNIVLPWQYSLLSVLPGIAIGIQVATGCSRAAL